MHHSKINMKSVYIAVTAASIAMFSLLVLICWRMDAWHLVSFGSEYIPVAPSTAWLMLMMGCALFATHIRPNQTLLRRLADATLICVAVFSLLVLGQTLAGFKLPLEHWMASGTEKLGNVVVGHMSPLTAATFLLAVPGIMLGAPHLSSRKKWRQWAALSGLITLAVGGGMLISYAAGAPFLYGNHIVPMALLTAGLFVLLGSCILITAGTDTWPLNVFINGITNPASSGLVSKGSLTSFLFFSGVIVTGGSALLNNQLSDARIAVQNELSAIGSLKVAQIAEWYKERQVDAEVVFNAPVIQNQAVSYLTGKADKQTERQLLTWMESQQRLNGYKRVVLYDSRGVPRLWAPVNNRPPIGTTHRDFWAALSSKIVTTTDLHHDPHDVVSGQREVSLNVWVPIGMSSQSQAPAVGLLLNEIDPYSLLFPLIRSWPIPSSSAETLLVRSEGNQVVYMSELMDRGMTRLDQRKSIDRYPSLPAALVSKAQEGVVEMVDHRDMPVLAMARKIEGTPWSLIVKVDKQEIYAPLRTRVWITGSIMLILVLLATMGLRLLLQRQGRYWLEQQLASEQNANRSLAHSNRLYTVLSQINRMIVQANDRQTLFQEVCRIMVASGGFRMACIGMLETKGHMAAAHADLPGFVEPCCVSPGGRHEKCAAVILISAEQAVACNRLESDMRLTDLRENALLHGYGSLAAAPFRLEDDRLAALTIYSSEPDFFSTDEMKLLEEVCSDIGYALQNIEQKRLKQESDQAIKQMQVQVIQQDKLASIGQLAAGVAHEINNPTGFISSNLTTLSKYIDRYKTYIKSLEEMVQNRCGIQAQDEAATLRTSLKIDHVSLDIHQLIGECIEGTERVRKIVLDLKTFSRSEGTEKGPTNINHCLDSTINIIWNEIKYVAALNRDYGDIPCVNCNSQQISQVFMNLLINAAHAIEKQGDIIVRTWSTPEAVFISVADSGNGIHPEHLNHIFEAFYTTKEPGKGTGLGLSISSEIVRRHDGEIRVASEIGKGTTFTVRLPLASQ